MTAFAVLVTVAVPVALVVLVVRLRTVRADRGGAVHDLAEAAFLNGGPPRVVDSVLAQLHDDGRIGVGGPGLVVVLRPDLAPRDPVERTVMRQLAAAPSGALRDLRLAVMRDPAVQEIGDGLAARGLLVDPERRRADGRLCGALGLALLGLLALSVVLSVTADPGRGEAPVALTAVPVLFLGALATLVCAGYNRNRVTRGGLRATAAYHGDHVYDPDAGHQVALRGLRALPNDELRTQLIDAARVYGTRRAQRPLPAASRSSSGSDGAAAVAVIHWCAGTPGGGPCGSSPGHSGGGSGRSESGTGGCSASACSSGAVSCASSSGGGSSGWSGSSCGSSSGGSSCGGSSGGSSCGGGSSG
ncbi:TIGR04222 domain-containing membrane protein [Streptomyces sp.]|uniref:TIGR04222 domain-containing membrane protein n=2 Tax=Streptomyces sp. TaxID=1931 RepID=UPI0028110EB8|nr:TIGR04222 domain-containing membrane protein [Streptomyces sp.]